ncbi:MAG: threonine/serine exporter family protein [Micropruina sp.]|uniref:threonine/serine exporter family protein n=1 Tax=Micropruina sp. TaxID=2737536 RepID=UPI0039E513FB
MTAAPPPTPTGPEPADGDRALVLGRLGALLLDAGMSVTDVRDTLDDIRVAELPQDISIGVLPDLVIVTRRTTGAAMLLPRTEADLSFRQSGRAGRLVRELRTRMISLAQADARIEEIRGEVAGHPVARWAFGSVLSAGGLAVLFRCPWWAILLSFAIGGLVGLLIVLLQRVRGATALAPFLASLLSTALLGLIATRLDLGVVPLLAVCAPIAVLVPGALITNGLLELTATDILTGSARLVYGLVVLAFMAAGISAGAFLTGLHLDAGSSALVGDVPGLVTDATGWGALPPLWLSWVGIVVLGIGVGLAFAAGSALTGLIVAAMALTYTLLVLLTPPLGGIVATGATSCVVLLLARILEKRTIAVPTMVSFLPAFLLLVPGSVALVALAAADVRALSAAMATFASLCIGTKLGSVLGDLLR